MERSKIKKVSRHLTIVISFTTTFLVAFLIVIHYMCYSIVSRHQLNERMTNTYDLAKVMVMPLWNSDTNMIRQISEAYLTCEYISGIRVETDFGKIFYDSSHESIDKAVMREEMIRQSDHYFGKLKVWFTEAGLRQTLRKSTMALVMISLPIVALILLGSHYYLKYFLKKTLEPNPQGA